MPDLPGWSRNQVVDRDHVLDRDAVAALLTVAISIAAPNNLNLAGLAKLIEVVVLLRPCVPCAVGAI